MGDKLRLKQVLINLLGNALKFTPVKGRIKFTVEIIDFDNEETENSAEKIPRLKVHFLVSDTGIGIKPEQMKNLFTAFEQADKSIAVSFGGTGLGLAISQNLVKQMGGLITVTSVFGEGSVFDFTLNMDIAEQVQEEAAAEEKPAADYSGKRILLTEDIEINRLIIVELLSDSNLKIDEAEDGAAALKRFSESPEAYYDLVFMDVQMPNMDGYESTRHIRALERSDAKTVPIIAMTANAYREDIDQARAAGMNDHLAKPIDINEVMKALEKWLG
jgi:CheY-like chemotaxis protein